MTLIFNMNMSETLQNESRKYSTAIIDLKMEHNYFCDYDPTHLNKIIKYLFFIYKYYKLQF